MPTADAITAVRWGEGVVRCELCKSRRSLARVRTRGYRTIGAAHSHTRDSLVTLVCGITEIVSEH